MMEQSARGTAAQHQDGYSGRLMTQLAECYSRVPHGLYVHPLRIPQRNLISSAIAGPQGAVDACQEFRFELPKDLRSGVVREGYLEVREDAQATVDVPAAKGAIAELMLNCARQVALISGQSRVNVFVVTTGPNSEPSWHRHLAHQTYLTLTIQADGEGNPGTVFAPYAAVGTESHRRKGTPFLEQAVGEVVKTGLWELGIFRGDLLHSSPDFKGRRTLLRAASL